MKWVFVVVCALVSGVPAFALQVPSAGMEGFTSMSKLPPGDQLPAAPLLIAAYSFVWVAVFFYVWSVGRRLNKVEAEMHSLERRQSKQSQAR